MPMMARMAEMALSSSGHWVAVTPSDDTDLAAVPRAIYVGVSGDVKMTSEAGDVVTFPDLAAGIVHALRPARIWENGTGAENIIALY